MVSIRVSLAIPGHTKHTRVMTAGVTEVVTVQSPYLVSAGQYVDLHLTVVPMVERTPGSLLTDARRVVDRGAHVPVSWDQMPLPSRRSLVEILQEAVQHGRDNPSHGTKCACMDRLSQEIKQQVSRAIPPDGGEVADIHWKVDARHRVRHVLGMVTRWL